MRRHQCESGLSTTGSRVRTLVSQLVVPSGKVEGSDWWRLAPEVGKLYLQSHCLSFQCHVFPMKDCTPKILPLIASVKYLVTVKSVYYVFFLSYCSSDVCMYECMFFCSARNITQGFMDAYTITPGHHFLIFIFQIKCIFMCMEMLPVCMYHMCTWCPLRSEEHQHSRG